VYNARERWLNSQYVRFNEILPQKQSSSGIVWIDLLMHKNPAFLEKNFKSQSRALSPVANVVTVTGVASIPMSWVTSWGGLQKLSVTDGFMVDLPTNFPTLSSTLRELSLDSNWFFMVLS